MKDTNAKMLLSLITMFLFGGVSGAMLDSYFRPSLFPPPATDQMEENLMIFLGKHLHLMPDQREKIRPTVSDFVHRTEILRQQSLQQFQFLADETDDQISDVLTTSQKSDLAKLRKERDEEFKIHGGLTNDPLRRLPTVP